MDMETIVSLLIHCFHLFIFNKYNVVNPFFVAVSYLYTHFNLLVLLQESAKFPIHSV